MERDSADASYAQNSRGLGVADMATAIVSGRPHRASGELAYHVLDIMESIHVASEEDRHVKIQEHVRPAGGASAGPDAWRPGRLALVRAAPSGSVQGGSPC